MRWYTGCGNSVVPKSIDSGRPGAVGVALLINLCLLSLFAVQHNVMARPWFKKVWTKVVAKQVERTTFVLFASAVLTLIFWQWRPMTGVIWEVQSAPVATLLTGISLAGWATVVLCTFLIDHFDLFGLRQVIQWNAYTRPVFKERSLYKRTRHPLYLSFMIAFWATPRMTTGHLLFAAVTTAWMIVSIQFEEHDLKRAHPEYADYKARVPMLLPLGRKTPP
jgi:methanethiol S-methyltransferase